MIEHYRSNYFITNDNTIFIREIFTEIFPPSIAR